MGATAADDSRVRGSLHAGGVVLRGRAARATTIMPPSLSDNRTERFLEVTPSNPPTRLSR
jgi:hypothetical protein